MKIVAHIKLQPTPEQADALKRTLETANAACNEISRVAWEQQVFGKYDLQQLVYQRIKADYGLSAQMVIRCLTKVGDSYKLDRKVQRTYRPHGSIAYDDRILSFNLQRQTVSMWTVADEHRQTIPFVCGERQRQVLLARQGESDLVFRNGQFSLLVPCTVDEPTPDDGDAVLGVDLGIVNLATDSDGETYSGAQGERVRQRYQRRRAALQSVGTKSAKRRLKKISGKQRRFQSNINHTIAKQLVRKAKGTRRALALEDLTHIRKRTEQTVRKSARAKLSNWSFNQLRRYISYKAQMCGVRVLLVDPRSTSQTCNRCGTVDKRNRPNQPTFRCVGCGHTNLADVNAACTIRDRAAVIRPMVSNLWVEGQAAPLERLRFMTCYGDR
ncbi:MAG: transposase [Herpetosiphonaceae bacterium]|nr:MAG: transposase [Herpetosiphonaceae bacterium]